MTRDHLAAALDAALDRLLTLAEEIVPGLVVAAAAALESGEITQSDFEKMGDAALDRQKPRVDKIERLLTDTFGEEPR